MRELGMVSKRPIIAIAAPDTAPQQKVGTRSGAQQVQERHKRV